MPQPLPKIVMRSIVAVVVVAVLVVSAMGFVTGKESDKTNVLSTTPDSLPQSTIVISPSEQENVSSSIQEKPNQESFSGVFYVSETPFPCGPDLKQLCTTLEVSPASAEVSLPWSSNIRETEVVGADGTAIGTGYMNTTAILDNDIASFAVSAAAYADAYVYDGKDDWYMPSRDELNELCKKFASDRQAIESEQSYDGKCAGSVEPSGGFAPEYYWSSSHYANEYYTAYFAAWVQHFKNGRQTSYTTKNYMNQQDYMPLVRPVRAF